MMSKTGRWQLRNALCKSALAALRYNPILMQMKQRLTESGKLRMVSVRAAMRKLVHRIYGVRKSDIPFDDACLMRPAKDA